MIALHLKAAPIGGRLFGGTGTTMGGHEAMPGMMDRIVGP